MKEIPWQAKRRMQKLKRSIERLRLWGHRITILMLLLILVALAACVIDFYF